MPRVPQENQPRTIELPAEPLSAARARRFVSGTVGTWVDDDVIEAARLVVSELVTNAIRHAGTAIEVGVVRTLDGLRVEVWDSAATLPVPRGATLSDESGRGLEIVDAVAQSWGVEPGPDGGKWVWADLVRG